MSGMTLDITVRGAAEQHHRADRAIVSLAVAIDGSDKQQVFAEAVSIQEPLTNQLKAFVELRGVANWSNDQLRVFSHRPWAGEGARGATVHVARVHVRAEFVDFERLSGFLDHWSGVDGVEIDDIGWDISDEHRRKYTTEVRKAAVSDAIATAQGYADAVRRGKVSAVQIADSGMLSGSRESSPPALYKAAAFGGDSTGPGLDLTPGDIVIRIEVDARFRAD